MQKAPFDRGFAWGFFIAYLGISAVMRYFGPHTEANRLLDKFTVATNLFLSGFFHEAAALQNALRGKLVQAGFRGLSGWKKYFMAAGSLRFSGRGRGGGRGSGGLCRKAGKGAYKRKKNTISRRPETSAGRLFAST